MDAGERAPEVDYHSHQAPEAYQEAPIALVEQQARYQGAGFPFRVPDSGSEDEPNGLLKNTSAANSKSTRVGGLPVVWFWSLLALVGVLIVGASVGGAVGGTMASKNKAQVAAQTTPTTTSPTRSSSSSTLGTTPSSSSSTPSTDCPASNGTTYTPLDMNGGPGTYQFTKYCGQDAAGEDVAAAYVMSFNLCIDLCSNYNAIHSNTTCTAVSFMPEGLPPGNCWAKASGNGAFSSLGRVSAAFLQ
ncbi:hypothetical protein LTR15_010267 [Elasticomyces elasticus]|nr:hypothetical protein LTR15_010267 [Elasticomyces elasticus]